MKNDQLGAFLLLGVCVCMACCKEPIKTTNTTKNLLNIHATYAGQPLLIGAPYPYSGTSKVRFDNLTFYLSDIMLVSSKGTVAVADNLFCDITAHHATAAGAAEGETLTLRTDIASDTYTAIRFGIGVAPIYNARSWTTYPTTNPLANADYYWSTWHSFIFAKVEGKMDTLGTGVQYPVGFSYHTGTDSLYRIITVPIAAFSVLPNATNTIPITLDVRQLFLNSPTDTFNIRRAPIPRIPPVTVPDIMALHHLVDNFARAFR